MFEHVIVRFGEISIKGNNRSKFENLLVKNVQDAIHNYPSVKVQKIDGRILVSLHGAPVESVMERLRRVFGVVSLSPVVQTDLTFDAIKEGVRSLAMTHTDQQSKSFKVHVRRANRQFPMESPEVARELGAVVFDVLPHWTVNLGEPEVTFLVEIRSDAVYITDRTEPGVGGMPVGISGKVGLLLSGGIDSPVAGWLCMKRGVKLEAIHFHSYPFTSERALQKVETLCKILATWGHDVVLHTVPFTEIQTEIRKHCREELHITVMRRFMMRIASQISRKRNLLALATGESLGQVASQTLESMNVINAVTNTPILRPLIAEDKVDIIHRARAIGTYETSILPYEDCCTVFVPKNPRIRPQIKETEQTEERLDVENLTLRAVQETTKQTFAAYQ